MIAPKLKNIDRLPAFDEIMQCQATACIEPAEAVSYEYPAKDAPKPRISIGDLVKKNLGTVYKGFFESGSNGDSYRQPVVIKELPNSNPLTREEIFFHSYLSGRYPQHFPEFISCITNFNKGAYLFGDDFALFDTENNSYVVMEDLGKITLRDFAAHPAFSRITKQKWAPVVNSLMLEVAKIMGIFEREDLVYRDLKPCNCMIVPSETEELEPSRGARVKLVDFGAVIKSGEAADGRCIGTMDFLSPEQGYTEEIDYSQTSTHSVSCCTACLQERYLTN
jgi:serine/threonine protein kinase